MNQKKIAFYYRSGVYALEARQFLPIQLNEAWSFFSAPGNLAKITPGKMGFKITSGTPGKMFSGQIITYKINISPLFSSNWVSEITHIQNKTYFVDEQRFGPYSMWHHEHHFEEAENGVQMFDRVTYKIPFGFIGHLAHSLFIKKQLKHIFSYREQILKEMFA